MVKYIVPLVFCLNNFSFSSAQVLDYSKAEKLPLSVNSDAEESIPLLSADGNILYFSRALCSENIGGKFSGQDVWSSTLSENGWKKAENKKYIFNNKNNNAVVGVSADGKGLFLLNSSSDKKVKGIYFTKKSKDGWDKPELIPLDGYDGYGFTGFYVSPDYDVILISMKGANTYGEEDLYYCLKNSNGSWPVPKNMGPAINTTGYEISPFLSSNKKRIYFSSNGYIGLGDADIYYSDMLYDSWETWTAPRNLGPNINSDKFDAFFSIYGDTVAYFTSNRSGGLADIYVSHATPGDEAYTITQRYLSEKDMNGLLGVASRQIVFDKDVTEVTAAQKEILYYIANKLLRNTDFSFHIVVQEDSQPNLSNKRQAAVYDQLRQAGIENYRLILMTGKARKPSSSDKGIVELILFK